MVAVDREVEQLGDARVQRIERCLLERVVVLARQHPDSELSTRPRPGEVFGVAEQMAVDEGEEAVDSAVVSPIDPAGLDLVTRQVVVLEHLLEAKVLEHLVAFGGREPIGDTLVDNPVEQDRVVFRHGPHSLH